MGLRNSAGSPRLRPQNCIQGSCPSRYPRFFKSTALGVHIRQDITPHLRTRPRLFGKGGPFSQMKLCARTAVLCARAIQEFTEFASTCSPSSYISSAKLTDLAHAPLSPAISARTGRHCRNTGIRGWYHGATLHRARVRRRSA
jgi:hypothetical protein